MNILLTNDDGYEAYGINLLAKLLKKYGDVYVVSFGDNHGECDGDIGAIVEYQYLGENQINSYIKDKKIKIFQLNEH